MLKLKRYKQWIQALRRANLSASQWLGLLTIPFTEQRVTKRVWRRRMAQCVRCPIYNHGTKTCMLCDCYMPIKACFADQQCAGEIEGNLSARGWDRAEAFGSIVDHMKDAYPNHKILPLGAAFEAAYAKNRSISETSFIVQDTPESREMIGEFQRINMCATEVMELHREATEARGEDLGISPPYEIDEKSIEYYMSVSSRPFRMIESIGEDGAIKRRKEMIKRNGHGRWIIHELSKEATEARGVDGAQIINDQQKENDGN